MRQIWYLDWPKLARVFLLQTFPGYQTPPFRKLLLRIFFIKVWFGEFICLIVRSLLFWIFSYCFPFTGILSLREYERVHLLFLFYWFSNPNFCGAKSLTSTGKVSRKIFLSKACFSGKMICCVFDQFWLHPTDWKCCSVTGLLFEFETDLIKLWYSQCIFWNRKFFPSVVSETWHKNIESFSSKEITFDITEFKRVRRSRAAPSWMKV